MDKTIVTIAGISLIAAIYWFFFGKKEEAMEVTKILVEGGYKPNAIKIKSSQSTTLTFLRKDPNPCLEEIIFPEFKIKKFLPMGQEIPITITPDKPGTFGFHCGMNMFHGRIEVV
ncbi:cupredoxin domain-containing protein [Candidatus Gottesmanbacteria bacterium]|nr:cupredoxin domain-containing protein [Candidatus Gottesmanbacteria bacterium]